MKKIDIFKLFYKHYAISTKVGDETYMISYYRSPFWTYDKRTVGVFLKDKLMWWHGQVWLCFPNGCSCGFGTICFKAIFPKRRMREFLKAESRRVYNITHKEDGNND